MGTGRSGATRRGLIADRNGGSGTHLHRGRLAIAALRQTGVVNVAIAEGQRSQLPYVNSILASPTQNVLPYVLSLHTIYCIPRYSRTVSIQYGMQHERTSDFQ